MIEFTQFSISILIVIVIILLYHVYLSWSLDENQDGVISKKEANKNTIAKSFLSGVVRGLVIGALVTQKIEPSLKYALVMGLINPVIMIFETNFD